eukprot:snap_masked-scaffold_30-processed-gene-1.31-mRNA-1 protein AED:1.00 eAED:1.00 QI:0/0/0/0/1/1/2/0/63
MVLVSLRSAVCISYYLTKTTQSNFRHSNYFAISNIYIKCQILSGYSSSLSYMIFTVHEVNDVV